jgi:hypothetical protein
VGREFVFVAARQTWGEDRVFFFAEDGTQKSLPRAWTDRADPDPFAAVGAGRCAFRVEDLVQLVDLLDGLGDGRSRPVDVNEIMPHV